MRLIEKELMKRLVEQIRLRLDDHEGLMVYEECPGGLVQDDYSDVFLCDTCAFDGEGSQPETHAPEDYLNDAGRMGVRVMVSPEEARLLLNRDLRR